MEQSAMTRAEAREPGWGWWLYTLVGVLSVAAGIIILFEPGSSLAAIAVISGIFLVVNAIAEFVMAMSDRTRNRGMVALVGVLSLIIGIALIRHPFTGVAAVALLIGLWLVAVGAIRLVAAVEAPERRTQRTVGAMAILIVGIVICASPGVGLTALAVLAGIAFILYGLGLVALGWTIHEIAVPAHGRHGGATPA